MGTDEVRRGVKKKKKKKPKEISHKGKEKFECQKHIERSI